MAPVIDYYYSVLSTWTYMGCEVFADMVARHGATVNHKPVNLLKVFKAAGSLPLHERPIQRRKYRDVEMRRWQAYRDIPMNFEPAFWPVSAKLADSMIIAAQDEGFDAMALSNALMRAVWAEERDVSDEKTLSAIAGEQSMDGAKLLDLAKGGHAEQIYAANADEAIARDVFGAPFYFFDGEPYWGQDRLDMLDAHLTRAAG